MGEHGYVVVMYDAPDDDEFTNWIHGPHYEEILQKTPGVRSITRLEVKDPAPGQQRYVALIETDDLDATIAWRGSPDGQRSQSEANGRGITNRAGATGRVIYEVRRP